MSKFVDFEVKVVRALIGDHLNESQVAEVLESAIWVSHEHTGVGYFLTVRHPVLPVERIVCDQPRLSGAAIGIECGFVVFLEGRELCLECYSWNDEGIPEDIRERQIEIEVVS